MRRTPGLFVECLETKSLLSSIVAADSGANPPPVQLTLTTDRSTYTVGQPVNFTLTETNTTDQVDLIDERIGDNDFVVYQNGNPVWDSAPPSPPSTPETQTEPILVSGLLFPNESNVIHATWDGTSNEAPLTSHTGTFEAQVRVVVNNVVYTPSATFTVNPPSPLTVNVAPGREVVRPGHPVRLIVTETNTSSHDVAVEAARRTLSVTVAHPTGERVWASRIPKVGHAKAEVLHSGQSRKIVIVWDTRPNQSGGKLEAGDYQVDASIDGAVSSAVIRVVH